MKEWNLTEHQQEKAKKQIEGINHSITYMDYSRKMINRAIIDNIPRSSKRLKVPEKNLVLDYRNMPNEFIAAIKKAKLNKKVHHFHNIKFGVDLVVTKMIGHFVSDLYNCLNHTFYLIEFTHPKEVVSKGIKIIDTLECTNKNADYLYGDLGNIIKDNKVWIADFKDKRRIDEHKSPFELYIYFRMRPETNVVNFCLTNNFNSNELDLFDMYEYLDRLKRFFKKVEREIKKIV